MHMNEKGKGKKKKDRGMGQEGKRCGGRGGEQGTKRFWNTPQSIFCFLEFESLVEGGFFFVFFGQGNNCQSPLQTTHPHQAGRRSLTVCHVSARLA